ncbi:DUF6961 family protein [Novosphingobium subterraneum]|uniref:DUF6961 family protein n=1 Tax=Novosphingobium subterraneum TaxID=48936 RepID=UPI0009DCEF78
MLLSARLRHSARQRPILSARKRNGAAQPSPPHGQSAILSGGSVKQSGDKAPLHVTEQIGALALIGDEAGIRTWQAIAEPFVQLSSNAQDRPLQ